MKKKLYVLVVSISFIGLFLFLSQKIVVKAVECSNQFGPCSQEVQDMANAKINESYFSSKKSLGKALSESTRIDNYSIRFRLPSTLIVDIVEKKAEVALKFSEEQFLLFDRKGNLVGKTTNTELPKIEVFEVPSEDGLKFSVELFLSLFKYYDVSSAELTKFSIASNVKGVRVIFPLEGDIDILLGAMEVSLLQLNQAHENSTINSAGNYNLIDLRYKNPVIAKHEQN